MFKMIAAVVAALVPFALAAQTDTTTATAPVAPAQAGAKSDAKKKYVPHKTPDAKKASSAPKKPAPPKPPSPPKKPSDVPSVIYDSHGNAIQTSPEAYDVSSATKKK